MAVTRLSEAGTLCVTGATGFVGRWLLAGLLRNTKATMHCVVRAADADAARARVVAALARTGMPDSAALHRRLVCHAGSVAAPRFGLSDEAYDALARACDMVFHCAAHVSFARGYTDLRDANVVMLFLWPEINLRLLPKLLRELRPGARIVSNMHDMGNFAPTGVVALGVTQNRPHRVYSWIVPAH